MKHISADREDKLLALVDGLASERTSRAEAQRARMDAIGAMQNILGTQNHAPQTPIQ